MIYQAHIERVGPHVADGLADNLLITFLADGPADCLEVIRLPGVAAPEAAGAASALVHISSASAAAIGVIGNMNGYSECQETRIENQAGERRRHSPT